MATLKAYTLGINGMPRRSVIEALGLESWVRQVNVCPVEYTKKAAHALLESRSIFLPIGNEEFRLDSGSDIEALREASLLDEPAVFAWPLSVGSGCRVVRILKGGEPELIGEFQKADGKLRFSAEVSA